MNGILLEAEVNKALRGDRVHPVITLIDTLPDIADFSTTYSRIKGVQQQATYAKQHFGFFADAVERLGHFSLDPFDLIAIWRKVAEMDLPRYETAAILGCAYAKAPFDGDGWLLLPRKELEGEKYPKELATRPDELKTYRERLEQVSTSLDEIDFYRFGVRKGFMQIARGLMSSNENEKQEASGANARSKRPEMEPLGRLGENWGNGMLRVYQSLDQFLTANNVQL
ncbi:hypothetical protein HYY71_02595 [Candidatus Woesearchaeota archaeon]|nr:hypothetical protein [Candidatus Woesearchaeota archaeon]